ncbi:chloride channel [Ochromonadaceae sp. CCMP2298]|nr:chloride channel [Ochromonadaceae sp. CCMP2298]|mmetsp:Transcript_9601/g.21041  ORF Transcript_9601/g.21041 Transcript_9601/m.21041 type:complete len:831 (-) Transcript_9601:64-2556(-)
MSPPSPLTLKRIEDGGIEMNPVTQGSPYVKISRKLSIVSEQGEGSVVPAKAWVQTFVAKNRILMVLCVVGVLTGVINGLAIWLVTVGSKAQARLLLLPSGHGVAWFIITTAGMCALSALITKTGGLAATFGSGMPEVKTLLVNDFLPHEYPLLVSPKILLLRLLSNISAVLSGLGIGMAGPLVHVSVSTAYCVVHYIPFFRKLEENPAVMKQIFAAAATVGLSTVFNAPVGGLLFSVEVTSTYYLISNYWRSFMASTIGAVMFDIVLKGRQGSYRLYQVPTFLNPYESWEFIMFFLIGIVTGVMAYLYLQMHQRWFLFVKPHVTKHPIFTAALGGAVSALLIWAVGAYSMKGVTGGVIVSNLFKSASISDMQTSYSDVSPIGGLFASFFVRWFLTLLGTTLRISAGIFVPMLTLGALIGRIFGQILQEIIPMKGSIYLGGYAMVGAAGMVAGTTHTISAAIIVVELSGELDMLVPCLIAAVISSGITKMISLSLYDQGMINKGLESFELLLKSGGSSQTAGEIMDQGCIHVTNKCRVRDLVTLLEDDKQQSIFPIISDEDGRVLQGSVGRKEIFLFVKRVFEKQSLMANLRALLPVDCEKEDGKKKKRRVSLSPSIAGGFASLGRSLSMERIPTPVASPAQGGFFSRLFPQRPFSSTAAASEGKEDGHNRLSTISDDAGDVGEAGGYPPSEGSRTDEVKPAKSPRNNSPLPTVKSEINLSPELQAALALDTDTPETVTPGQAGLVGLAAVNPSRLEFVLNTKVNLAEQALLPINGFPYTALSHTTMDQLYVLFEMVHVSCVFVVDEGKSLQGIISKKALLKNIKSKGNVK